mmetsp:Transcript_45643/g.145680  ORF Transcript_45643/g.145680 Transcript_45643/m.145680 type:complete len:289 (+) Transcript_45643:77-943(+)
MASADDCRHRGNRHFEQKEYQLAIEAYSEAISQDPQECAYWLNRSNAHRHLQQWPAAEHDAAQALELEPSNSKACYGRVICLQRLGRLADALAACDAGLAVHAENKALQQLRLDVLQEQKRQAKKSMVGGQQVRDGSTHPPTGSSRALAERLSSSSSSSSSSGHVEHHKGGKVSAARVLTRDELPCQQLCDSASRGDAEECRRLLETGDVVDVNWQRPEDGNTALHLAAEESHMPVVRALLAAGANAEVMNHFLLTPFALATPGGEVERLLGQLTKPLSEDRRAALRT